LRPSAAASTLADVPTKRSPAELLAAIETPSFTPGARDIGPLCELLAGADDISAEAALRALVRAPEAASKAARERFDTTEGIARPRLCDLVGRIALQGEEPELRVWLEERLADSVAIVRRRAARSLGKIGRPESEAPLLAALACEEGGPEKKAVAEALGKIGGQDSSSALAALASEPGELGRVAGEAEARLQRVQARAVPTVIDPDAVPRRRIRLLLHVRAGLEELLVSELAEGMRAETAGRGRVTVELAGPLARLWRARTFLHFGFPLRAEKVVAADGGDGVEMAVVRALTSDTAREILTTFTRGPIRWRLEWGAGGHRRAATLRVARAVAERCPELVNDPREAPWEAVVHEGPSAVTVELWPRGLEDPRFTWRVRTVPAASHPTIAAALALVAGARAGDVVWDPFVGAGAELVERARLGSYSELFGTDTDADALSAARANLATAKVRRVRLVEADARTFDPGRPVSLVITNPPMGRRAIVAGSRTGELLVEVLKRAVENLTPDGRIVWMSPLPSLTARAAKQLGLVATQRLQVDMGGFDVELQAFARATVSEP
jgi:23S rRNA G2445 N2-methylase RlmL